MKDSINLKARLEQLLRLYADCEGAGFKQAIRDTLTDLRHLCDARCMDFAKIDRAAREVYIEERTES